MTSREAAKSSIRASLDQLKQWFANGRTLKLSEADTKAALIDKYLAALGYREILDIQREYQVKGTQERIDYVLKDKDQLILAIEAKAMGHELNYKAAAQLIQYCSVEGIEWCALTDGVNLHLYNQFVQQPLDGKLVFKLNLLDYSTDQEFDALFDSLWLLSRESMTTPSGIRSWMEHQQIDKALRSVLLDPSSAPIDYLRTMMLQLGVNVSAEAIVQWFRSQLASPVTSPLPTQFDPTAPHTTILVETKVGFGTNSDRGYWVLPAGERLDITAMDTLKAMLAKNIWGMYKSTPGRKRLKGGDCVAFYAAKVGVVATAEVAAPADQLLPKQELPKGLDVPEPVYRVPLRKVHWLRHPVPIDESVRAQLDAFQGKPTTGVWSWFIQTTRQVSEHDFRLLTAEAG